MIEAEGEKFSPTHNPFCFHHFLVLKPYVAVSGNPSAREIVDPGALQELISLPL